MTAGKVVSDLKPGDRISSHGKALTVKAVKPKPGWESFTHPAVITTQEGVTVATYMESCIRTGK